MADESSLRLFLSADVVNSTALKNSANHSVLLSSFRDFRNANEAFAGWLSEEDYLKKPPDLDAHDIDLFLRQDREVTLDWAFRLRAALKDFDTLLKEGLRRIVSESVGEQIEKNPWKSIGDELVYSFTVKSKIDVHEIARTFLQVLRDVDKNSSKREDRLRFKGAAWTAGFPIRNREFPDLAVDTDPPWLDFLGPDMDVGFRLCRFTYAGVCAASYDLVDLLGRTEIKEQLRGCIVGWKELKGIWQGNPYPIFWISQYDDPDAEKEDRYDQFSPWDEKNNSLVKAWRAKRSHEELKSFGPEIERLREELSPLLGLVRPYIVDEEELPPDHAQILEILERKRNLDALNLKGETGDGALDEDRIRDKLNIKDSTPGKTE